MIKRNTLECSTYLSIITLFDILADPVIYSCQASSKGWRKHVIIVTCLLFIVGMYFMEIGLYRMDFTDTEDVIPTPASIASTRNRTEENEDNTYSFNIENISNTSLNSSDIIFNDNNHSTSRVIQKTKVSNHPSTSSSRLQDLQMRQQRIIMGRTRKFEKNAARLAALSATVSGCSHSDHQNILCATPKNVGEYPQTEYLPQFRNPCVCISNDSDPNGPRIVSQVKCFIFIMIKIET